MPWRREKPLSNKEVSAILHEQRKKARFLIDESLGIGVTHLLRRLGWNVKDVHEVGLNGKPDENVLAFAKAEDRILLTHDPDFLDERRFPHHRNPGVVILPGAQGNERALLRALGQMVAVVGRARDLYRATRIVITEDLVWTVRTFEPSEGRVVVSRYRMVSGGMETWHPE